MPSPEPLDAVIVGGGAAGLAAALVFGRCARPVVVVDAGRPRNRFTEHIHGFPTRDGARPMQWLSLARRELLRYPTVERYADSATRVRREGRSRFVVETTRGRVLAARAVLL